MKEKLVKIRKEKTTFALISLPGSTLFQNIRLKAINRFGLMSEFITCKNIKTCEPSREEEIREEVARVKASTEPHIDSDFFQPGVLQREERVAYLIKLKDLLNTTTQGKGSRSGSSPHAELKQGKFNEQIGHMNYPFVMRQDKFEFRINSLRREIEELRKKRQGNSEDRMLFILNMRQSQDKVFLLQGELNSLDNCKEEYMSTNVLNGSTQKMKKCDLRDAIEEAIGDNTASISLCRLKMIEGDKESKKLDTIIETKEGHLMERLAAYNVFKNSLKTTSKMKSNISRHTNDILKYYMMIWLQNTKLTKNMHLALNMITGLRARLVLFQAIQKWKANTIQTKSISSNQDISKAFSKGGVMLSEVHDKRLNARDEVKSSIVDLYGCIESFIPGKRNIDLSNLPETVSFEIIRGDHYHNLDQYKDAIRIYLAVLNGLPNDTSILKSTYNLFYCMMKEKV